MFSDTVDGYIKGLSQAKHTQKLKYYSCKCNISKSGDKKILCKQWTWITTLYCYLVQGVGVGGGGGIPISLSTCAVDTADNLPYYMYMQKWLSTEPYQLGYTTIYSYCSVKSHNPRLPGNLHCTGSVDDTYRQNGITPVFKLIS